MRSAALVRGDAPNGAVVDVAERALHAFHSRADHEGKGGSRGTDRSPATRPASRESLAGSWRSTSEPRSQPTTKRLDVLGRVPGCLAPGARAVDPLHVYA